MVPSVDVRFDVKDRAENITRLVKDIIKHLYVLWKQQRAEEGGVSSKVPAT